MAGHRPLLQGTNFASSAGVTCYVGGGGNIYLGSPGGGKGRLLHGAQWEQRSLAIDYLSSTHVLLHLLGFIWLPYEMAFRVRGHAGQSNFPPVKNRFMMSSLSHS